MKNLILAIALIAGLSVTSCSKTDKAADEQANDFKSKIENCTNPDSIAMYVDQAQAYAQKLADEGKIDEAKKYLADIQPIVEEKAPKLAGTFNVVKDALDKLPVKADSLKNVAVDTLKSVGANAVDSAKTAIANMANESVEGAKSAVNAKADELNDKATDAVNKAEDSAKDKLNNLLK